MGRSILVRLGMFCAVAAALGGTVLAEPDPVDVDGLTSMLVGHQFEYLIIAPPTWDVFIQPYGTVVPVDVKALPQPLRKGMDGAPSYADAMLYRVVAIEDVVTRDILFLSLTGEELLRIEAPEGYDPFTWQKELFGEEEWENASAWDRWFFDTARVGALFALVDVDDRLTDFFTGTSAAERDTLSDAHNLDESVAAGESQ